MFKNTKLYLIMIFLFLICVSQIYGVGIIDKSKIDSGIIDIKYTEGKDKIIKVVINKDNLAYVYDVTKDCNRLPLQLGNGTYKITIASLISGNKYRVLHQEIVNLNLLDTNKVYLQSIQDIYWNEEMDIIKKAKELTRNSKTNLDKVRLIHKYITNNIKYDYGKINKAGYIPSIEKTDKDKTGVCFDFASLTAGMLRSVGVPTKLVTGEANGIDCHHAWNQVYLPESDKWVTIDTTWDSVYLAHQINCDMTKDASLYKIKKEY